jgi:heat-inducible transcriptional repressor
MHEDATLTARQEAILLAVCRDYVTTGDEVSSGGLLRTHNFPWSSATIRQELAQLERKGYLHRSHHSSGRLPTRTGMELYVARLPGSRSVAPVLAAAVDLSLHEHAADTDRLRATSRVLSEAAGCVAVSFLGGARVGRIGEIEVVPFLGARALVVLSFDDGSTVMRPVNFDQAGDADDFAAAQRRICEKLRMLCRGRTLEAARAELLRLKDEDEARFDRSLAEALRVGLIVCAGAALDPLWLHVAGQPSLARGLPTNAATQLHDLLELLEDYRQLADVLCQLLPGPTDEDALRARVRLGVPLSRAPERGGDSLELTVVGCRLPLPQFDGSTGAVALLGTDRMDYASVIPLVEYAARTLAAHTGA